jgi:hypothetical protein
VKQIYRALKVQNRGELMALFIDRRILEALGESDEEA